VIVDSIHAASLDLRVFPANAAKPPRLFEIHSLILHGMALGRSFSYQANLTNPTPPGVIQVSGDFGPWLRLDPGSTALSGNFTFDNADLSIFKTIAGVLTSTGHFSGVLRRIEVDGETRTPKFRLAGGNAVPLTTRFHSIVDGTSGDTLLEPVRAVLGSSSLVALGRVFRPKGASARTVSLDVTMLDGHVQDLLRLAVNAPEPFLHGELAIRTKMEIIPGSGPYNHRLHLNGTFDLDKSQFTGASIRQKLDELSRRAQGQPRNSDIADVLSSLSGGFEMRDGQVSFTTLMFQVPGAAIHLSGTYGFYSEEVDLHGIACLQGIADDDRMEAVRA
jgi:hypothetical protein